MNISKFFNVGFFYNIMMGCEEEVSIIIMFRFNIDDGLNIFIFI